MDAAAIHEAIQGWAQEGVHGSVNSGGTGLCTRQQVSEEHPVRQTEPDHRALEFSSVPDGDMQTVNKQAKDMAATMIRLEEQHVHLSAQKNNIRAGFDAVLADVAPQDMPSVQKERSTLRHEHQQNLAQRLQEAYGKHYQSNLLTKAERTISTELGEPPAADESRSIREQLNTLKQTQEHHPDKNKHDHTQGR